MSALLLLLSTAVALADGKIFALDSVLEPPIVPDQQALIHFADGTETLVVETRFTGAGNHFAWVVPLPALPEISAVSRGLFPTLQSVFRPRIIGDDIVDLKAPIVGLTLIAVLFLFRKRLKHWTLVLVLLILLLVSVMLPSLARSRTLGIPTDDSGVTIHSRELVGDFEVSTISATESGGLVCWLTTNGFGLNERDREVIAEYVKEQWFFAAVKLSRGQSKEDASTPHPLAFKFRADAPVYPLRLTGTQDVPCRIDLYVFGPGTAAIDHPEFKTIQCGLSERLPDESDPLTWRRHDPDTIALVHPKLCSLVPGTPVATKLSGTLTPASMSSDAHISWQPARILREKLYTPTGLWDIVGNYAVAAMSACSLLFLVLAKFGRIRPHRAAAAWGITVLAITAAGCSVYACVPKTSLRPPNKAAFANCLIQRSLLPRRVLAESIVPPKRMAQDPDQFRAVLAKLISEGDEKLRSAYARNNFTGQPRIEEDSPGNYGLRQTPSGVEYLWYDRDGGEQVVRLAEMERVLDTQPASLPTSSPD